MWYTWYKWVFTKCLRASWFENQHFIPWIQTIVPKDFQVSLFGSVLSCWLSSLWQVILNLQTFLIVVYLGSVNKVHDIHFKSIAKGTIDHSSSVYPRSWIRFHSENLLDDRLTSWVLGPWSEFFQYQVFDTLGSHNTAFFAYIEMNLLANLNKTFRSASVKIFRPLSCEIIEVLKFRQAVKTK